MQDYRTVPTSRINSHRVNPQPEEIKEFRLKVTPKLVRGIGVIKPGDIIQITYNFPIQKGKFCLVSYCENQWIEIYSGYKKKDHQYYAITKIVMMG
jgi:hypothetical protein